MPTKKKVKSLVLEPLKDNALEKEHAVAFMDWLNLNKQYKDVFHVPNGQYRDKMIAFQLKKEGVKPGVSDFIWPHARGPWHHLYIELKKNKGRVSGSQYKWRKRMLLAENCYVVAFGWEQAVNVLSWYDSLGPYSPEFDREALQRQIDESTGASVQLDRMTEEKETKHKQQIADGKSRG